MEEEKTLLQDQQTDTEPETISEPEREISPREQALNDLLEETRKNNAELKQQLHDLKVLNEKLLIQNGAAAAMSDNDLFGAFDKYNKLRG